MYTRMLCGETVNSEPPKLLFAVCVVVELHSMYINNPRFTLDESRMLLVLCGRQGQCLIVYNTNR